MRDQTNGLMEFENGLMSFANYCCLKNNNNGV